MTDLDELVELADSEGIRFRLPTPSLDHDQARHEILFDAVQLPLVALTTLACLSLAGRQSFPLSETGLRVGAALMAAFPKFEVVGRRLQWSLRVRAITSDAIVFLEQADLVTVADLGRGRSLAITTRGRSLIEKARRDNGEVGRLTHDLRVAARRTRSEKLRLV